MGTQTFEYSYVGGIKRLKSTLHFHALVILSLSLSHTHAYHNMEVNFHSYSDKSGIAWWEQCWWITTHINKVYQERSIALLSHKNQSLSDPCMYSTNYLIFCIILNTRHISKNFAPRSTCSQESVFKVSMCLALHKSKV